jgi:uroporphyrinogen decarboxylase
MTEILSSAPGINRLRKYSKRERLEMTLSGAKPDRVPVSLWRHFPVDDQTPVGLANATLDFQRNYDFDFIKVTPTSSFCLKDWGSTDEWNGATEGTRDYTSRVIHTAEDWIQLKPLDPYRGYLGEQLACLQFISSALEKEEDAPPFIQTIFSPLSQAKNLVGGDQLLVHLRKHPHELRAGLKIIAESTLRFIEAAVKTGMAGIFYAVQHANYHLLSKEEYIQFGEEYDMIVLAAVRDLWFNVLHLHGENTMFDTFIDYPVQVINWHDRDTEPALAVAHEKYSGVLCGGLQRNSTMVVGSPKIVTAEAHDAIQQTSGVRFILGTGCVLPIVTSHANIYAARRSVEH